MFTLNFWVLAFPVLCFDCSRYREYDPLLSVKNRSFSAGGTQPLFETSTTLPGSQSSHSTQSHRLCAFGLVSIENPCLSDESHRLSDQTGHVVRLLEGTTQNALCSDGFCVSPESVRRESSPSLLNQLSRLLVLQDNVTNCISQLTHTCFILVGITLPKLK